MNFKPLIELSTDVAIIGSGAAGLMAAIHTAQENPDLDITIVSKGIVGRSGCSIMTIGFNAAVDPSDSAATHFEDLLRRGEFINDQELAWILASSAPAMVEELERYGCHFDRDPDGKMSVRPFPGQSASRHFGRRGQTGLEIMGRVRDQVLRIQPRQLEDVRALDLLRDDSGEVCGVVLLDMASGEPITLSARVVVVATGGAPTIYRVSSAAREKTGDGLAMCLRAGAEVRDMEMMLFLSVGLATAPSRLAGMLLSETLRIAGGRLYNSAGERFMEAYEPEAMEAARVDSVVRAAYREIVAGRGTDQGGVLLDVSHLGADVVAARFPEFIDQARLAGFDLTREPVPVTPSSHFQIGGVVIDAHCETTVPGLLVAGEDAGGVHGAAWSGGNGIAESTIFGARAGERAAAIASDRRHKPTGPLQVAEILERAFAPLAAGGGVLPADSSTRLKEAMWECAGPVRTGAGLRAGVDRIAEIREQSTPLSAPPSPEHNMTWQEAIDLQNQLEVADVVVQSALCRQESRGVHFRDDHPDRNDAEWLRYVVASTDDAKVEITSRPVQLSRLAPEQRDVP